MTITVEVSQTARETLLTDKVTLLVSQIAKEILLQDTPKVLISQVVREALVATPFISSNDKIKLN